MEYKPKDTNTILGILALGLFFANLGYFLNKYIKDTSLVFFNGFIDGVSAVLMIIGSAMVIYSIVSLAKQKKKK